MSRENEGGVTSELALCGLEQYLKFRLNICSSPKRRIVGIPELVLELKHLFSKKNRSDFCMR